MTISKFISFVLSLLLFSLASLDVGSLLRDTIQEEKELIEEGKLGSEKNKEIKKLTFGGDGDPNAFLPTQTTKTSLYQQFAKIEVTLITSTHLHSPQVPLYLLFHSLKIPSC